MVTGQAFSNEESSGQGLRRRLGVGTAWIAGSRIAINVLGLLSTIVLARLLTPADFGLVAIASALMLVLSAITELSLTSALIQRRVVERCHIDTAFTLNLCRAVLVTMVMAASAWPIAIFYSDARLVDVVLCLSLSTLVTGLVNPGLILLNRQLLFSQDFVLSVSEKAAVFVTQVSIALIWQSYWALVWGFVAGPIVRAVLSYRYAPHLPRLSWSAARELWSFSGWLTASQIINTLNWRLDVFLVGWFLGPKSLGYYTVGDNLAQMPTREAIAPLTQTLFPGLARVADSPERLRRAYQNAQSLITSIALPAGVGFALLAEPMVLLVMGEKWIKAVIVVQVLSSIFALQTLGSLVNPLAMATGNTRMLFWRDLLILSTRIPLVVTGLLVGGLPGLVGARAITGLSGIIMSICLVRKITGLTISAQLLANMRSLIGVFTMALVVLVIQHTLDSQEGLPRVWTLALCVGVGGVCYVGTHVLLWFVAGCPEGPETVAIAALKTLRSRLANGGRWRGSGDG
jgi:PST family polysaccharide transporter